MKKIALLAVLIACSGAIVSAHDPYDAYKNSDGTRCCGLGNCIEAVVKRIGPGQVTVNGVPLVLPEASIHANPVPEMGRWCYAPIMFPSSVDPASPDKARTNNTLCVFYNYDPT